MLKIFYSTNILEFQLKRNNIITNVKALKKEFILEFDIRPIRRTKEGWGSILKMFNNDKDSGYGARIPLILFHENSFKLLFGFYIKNQYSHTKDEVIYFDSKQELDENVFSTITIKQIAIDISKKSYRFSIEINHKEIHHMKNWNPDVYQDVQVAMGDRFHYDAHAEIKNFKLVNLGKGSSHNISKNLHSSVVFIIML